MPKLNFLNKIAKYLHRIWRFISMRDLDQRSQDIKNNIGQQRLSEKESDKAHINDLNDQIVRLNNLREKLPGHIIEAAKEAFLNGDNEKAEQLFIQVEEQAALHITAAAEAAYQRGKIAEGKNNYNDTFNHYYRASQLISDNLIYLLEAGSAARNIANYAKEIKLTEQVLALYTIQDGENSLIVARSWVNLGRAWKIKGENDTAIEYYEKALNSYLTTFNKAYPNVAICWANSGLIWKAKGETDKVIGYYEKTLSILINVLDESQSSIQVINDNSKHPKDALLSV